MDIYRKSGLKPASESDLVSALHRLLEKRPELASEINRELEEINAVREDTNAKAMTVYETDKRQLSIEQKKELLDVLKTRFESNMYRHYSMKWVDVFARLEANPEKLWSLNEMERTGGEPDVLDYDEKTGEFIFYDCSIVSPKGRRNLCYDRAGQEKAQNRAQYPAGNAVDMAAEMGIEILTEKQYMRLQSMHYEVATLDRGTRSWVKRTGLLRKMYSRPLSRRYNNPPSEHEIDFHYGWLGFRGLLRV